MTALDVLQEVNKVGGRLLPNGKKIIMEAKEPLPQELIDRIRDNKPALLAILNPRPPRLSGGLAITDTGHPCLVCGGVDWMLHLTYRYCCVCGRENGPGAIADSRELSYFTFP